MNDKKIEYHKKCHDCGHFLVQDKWVRKDHPWKRHALCPKCFSKYDDPNDY